MLYSHCNLPVSIAERGVVVAVKTVHVGRRVTAADSQVSPGLVYPEH